MTKRIDNLRKRAHEAEAEVQRLKIELRAANAEVHKLNVEILHAKEDERRGIVESIRRLGIMTSKFANGKVTKDGEDGESKPPTFLYALPDSPDKRIEFSDEETHALLNGYISGIATANAMAEVDGDKWKDNAKLLNFIAFSVGASAGEYACWLVKPEQTEDVEYAGD